MHKEFKDFLMRGNIVELAVAVVIGAAFGAVVTSLVSDLLTPLIGAIIGATDFSKSTFAINGSEFFYGKFVNALISFVSISAAVFFFVVKPVSALNAKLEKGPKDDKPAEDIALLTEIRDALKAR